MPRFKIRCYERGIWDQIAPVTVEAVSMMEAAELVSGDSLERSGPEDRLRVAVWAAGTIPEPVFFYQPIARCSTVVTFRRNAIVRTARARSPDGHGEIVTLMPDPGRVGPSPLTTAAVNAPIEQSEEFTPTSLRARLLRRLREGTIRVAEQHCLVKRVRSDSNHAIAEMLLRELERTLELERQVVRAEQQFAGLPWRGFPLDQVGPGNGPAPCGAGCARPAPPRPRTDGAVCGSPCSLRDRIVESGGGMNRFCPSLYPDGHSD